MLKHKNTVGWVTIFSGVIGFLSYILVAGAVNFNFEFFSNTSLIFSMKGVSSTLLKWSMITDIFGYYLLLLPVLFYIHEWLDGKTEWKNIITFCGASYIFAGALGASILAAAWPALLDKFATATPDQQEMIKISFDSLSLVVGNGIWNLFDAFMFGFWFISIGLFLKQERTTIGWITIFVGILSSLDFLGNVFGLKALAEISLNLYLIFAPLWAILIGIIMLRNKGIF